MFELFGNPGTVDYRCLVPKFFWLLWKFPPMSTLKAILLKVCCNTIKLLLPGISPHPEVNVSFKLMAEMECCVTLRTVHCVLFLAVFFRWKTEFCTSDPAHFRTREIWIICFFLQRLQKRPVNLPEYIVFIFLFLAQTAINIMHQSVMTEFFHSCDEACDSHNLTEY